MMLHRRAFAGLLASFAATTTARAQARTVEITMKQSPKVLFAPATVNIRVGDTVKWTNPGFVTHSVTFDPAMAQTQGDVVLPAGVAPFDSGSLEQDQTFSHQFTVKGAYKYICKFHEAMGMVGTVIVN